MSINKKRVAVVGAGISGIVTAAHLKSEGLDVTVFERSSAAGGIWFYDERKPLDPVYPSVPASKAGVTYIKEGVKDVDLERLLHAPPGPCYIGLKNNVSTRLLETTLNKFPPGTEDFVPHNVLKDYIQDTAVKTNVDAITRYDTEVQNIQKQDEQWVVKTSRLQRKEDGTQSLETATSNFLLIGGSVSAVDIARELGPLANTIYQSHRNGKFDLSANLLPENAIRVDEVTSFSLPNDANSSSPLTPSDPIPLTATLKSGQKLCDIHHVILCTGYHLTVPFLPHLHSDTTPVDQADEKVLVTDGTQFHNLHRDIFYIPDPTLSFVGVPFFTATFTLFEFQAMVVAKVLADLVNLPSQQNMRDEYNARVKAKGYGKSFHSLRDQEQEYVDGLLEWVNKDLEKRGRGRLAGHTEQWRIAKEEQVERIKALFAAPRGVERQVEVTCYS
ncbi:hypothetical protein N0V94_008926 [Neodidymelliopsis sp. IMI 364377]|nr:hypothetical protein N0V94_008926 [Neodidymelliopsis sp. IMI 364377]